MKRAAHSPALGPLRFRHVTLDWSRPYIMGVVNVTPDSFSDGGRYLGLDAAVRHGEALAEAGADLLDLGGEATNPRAAPVDADVERRRIVPVIEALAARVPVPLSVDTTKAEVAAAAVDAGAELVNDVSGGLFDPAMAEAVARCGAAYVCSHLRGRSLAEVFAHEAAVPLAAVIAELGARLDALPAAVRARTLVDPGLGFGKGSDPAGNLALLAGAGALGRALGRPVLVGPSRKRFISSLREAWSGAAPGAPPDLRNAASRRPPDDELWLDAATVGACLAAVSVGANVLRVHNVLLLRPALLSYSSIGASTGASVDASKAGTADSGGEA